MFSRDGRVLTVNKMAGILEAGHCLCRLFAGLILQFGSSLIGNVTRGDGALRRLFYDRH